jgi:hypothetical protein
LRIKTKCGSSPKGFACVLAQTIADVVAGDECDQVLGARINGVDFGVGSRVANGSEDPLDDQYKAKHGTEAIVIGPWLGRGVHLVSILLVNKGDGNIFGFGGQVFISVVEVGFGG